MSGSAPVAPWAGFRMVFALANGAIWFLLSYGILSGITFGMQASGRLTPGAFVVCALVVAFFVGFFGAPGAMGGLIGPARSGRFKLPPESSWGTSSQVAWAWPLGALIGAANVAIGYGLTTLRTGELPSRNKVCLLIAGGAAALAVLQSLFLSRTSGLGDLRAPTGDAPAPTDGYFLRRFAVPQGLGNGFITAVVAIGTFPPEGALPPLAVAIDSAGTASIIAFFMLVSGGGLANTDLAVGRIAALPGKPPSKLLRALIIPALAIVAGAVGYGAAAALGGFSLPISIAWKGALGGVIAGVLAARAARWTLMK